MTGCRSSSTRTEIDFAFRKPPSRYIIRFVKPALGASGFRRTSMRARFLYTRARRSLSAGGCMRPGFRVSTVFALIAAAGFVIHADGTPPSQAAEVQVQLGTMLNAEGRYIEALDAFQNALKTTDTSVLRAARAGVIVN